MPTRQVPIIVRLLYFFFAGLWIGTIAAEIGWICCVTIVGLPLGIYIFHRLPLVMTLKMPDEQMIPVGPYGYYRIAPPEQSPPLPARIVWFILVGWWFSFFWVNLALILGVTVIFTPVAFWMVNKVPALLTLEGV